MEGLTNNQLEQLAVFKAICDVLDGKEVSDFFMSFWPVRRVWDLMQTEKKDSRFRVSISQALNEGDGVYRP